MVVGSLHGNCCNQRVSLLSNRLERVVLFCFPPVYLGCGLEEHVWRTHARAVVEFSLRVINGNDDSRSVVSRPRHKRLASVTDLSTGVGCLHRLRWRQRDVSARLVPPTDLYNPTPHMLPPSQAVCSVRGEHEIISARESVLLKVAGAVGGRQTAGG